MFKILYLGDVMAEPGLRLVENLLPGLRQEHQLDLVVAQAENVTDGRGINKADFGRLRRAGIDFCTGGNWTLHNPEIHDHLNDLQQPILRPANYPAGTPGQRYKYLSTGKGRVLFISLLGSIVGKDAGQALDNPLQVVDQILTETADDRRVATVVNLHGDFSSEKVIIGHYLDGRASLVVGDHWHVPTADEQILPAGTAHQTDVGMCGVLQASLGVTFDSVIPRWRDGARSRNIIETDGPKQLNGLIAAIDEQTGLATSLERLRLVIE